jgi:hypothetical protein
MNSPRESIGAATVRVLSRMFYRQPSARPRRFRPLAEPMEARAVLSHVGFTRAIIDPIALGHGSSAIVHRRLHLAHATAALSSVRPMDAVEVNGQVEIQPGD